MYEIKYRPIMYTRDRTLVALIKSASFVSYTVNLEFVIVIF